MANRAGRLRRSTAREGCFLIRSEYRQIGRDRRPERGASKLSGFHSVRSRSIVALFVGVLLVAMPNIAASAIARQTSATFSVGVMRCTFVDHARGVLNYMTSPPSPLSFSRTLVTEIRYPTLDGHVGVAETSGVTPAGQHRGFPMVLFAHGYDVTPDIYAPLLDAWAKAGFIVASPLFPAENRFAVAAQHNVNTEDDMVNEPADLTFVTRQLLAVSASASSSPTCPLPHGLIRASALALAGHSDGATVVGTLAYAHGTDRQGVTYQSLRAGLHYRGTMIFSGQQDIGDPYGPLAPNSSLLVVQSLGDRCNRAANAVQLYNDVRQPDKWFLELQAAHHLPPFDGVDVPAFDVVARTTTRFLQLVLEQRKPASDLLADGDVEPSVARMFEGGSVTLASNSTAPIGACGLT